MTIGEFFTFLGYVVGAAVFYWAAKRRKLATDGIGLTVAIGLAAGIGGAKLTQLVFEGWPLKIPFSSAFEPETGGRALLGGVLFGWVGVMIAKWRLGIRRSTGDMFALALPAGEAVGRIGCYFNQCCYGIPCRLPWAIYQHGAWRHPTQIYSSFTSLGIFGWLLWEARRRGMLGLGNFMVGGAPERRGSHGEESLATTEAGRSRDVVFSGRDCFGPEKPSPLPLSRWRGFLAGARLFLAGSFRDLNRGRKPALGSTVARPEPEGELFFLYLIGFGVSRFLIEFLRWRESVYGGLSPMQWFCLDLVVVGAIGLKRLESRAGTVVS